MAMGLKQDRPGSPGHFCVGVKPPPYFKRPYNEPVRNWENTITFFNGSCVELISVDRQNTLAGGSYDYAIVDEGVYFPKAIHDAKLIPSMRGNVQYFGDCPFHGSRFYCSSQAWDPAGYWVEDQKWLRDTNGEFVLDEKGNKILDPEVLFVHGTSWDNRHILTEKTLNLWQRTLPRIVYDIEIMAKRYEKISNSFYERFDTKTHTYLKSFEYGYDYERNEFGVFTKKEDTDRDGRLGMKLSFDFGTNFNSMIVAQHHKSINELRIIREFFESSNQLITNLVEPFCKFYESHPTKIVELFGDPAGNKIGHMEKLSLFQKISDYLKSKGWRVINQMRGRAYPLHKVKHQFINEVLSETNHRMAKVRINMHACKFLLTSIKNAPMDKNFSKKKTSERQDIPQETATHLSDCFDYLVYYYLNSLRLSTSSGGGARLGSRMI